MRTKLLCLLALISCAALAAQDLTLDQILQKHFEAMGGLDKMKSVQTVSMTAKIVMGGGQMEAPMTMKMKRPNMMRSEMTIQGKTFVRASDGTIAWQINPFMGSPEPAKLADNEAKDALDNADIDGALLDFKAKGHAVELAGKEDVEGTPAYKLKVTKKSGRVEYQWIDASNFLGIKSATKVSQMGQEIEVESYPANYKKVEGVMMPYSMDQRVGGRSMMNMTMEKIDVNQPIDNSIFQMPAPAPKPEEKKN